MGITSGDLGLIAGFLAFAVLAFWLVGRAAERGMLAGSSPWVTTTIFCILAIGNAFAKHWIVAACAALAALFQVTAALRDRRARR